MGDYTYFLGRALAERGHEMHVLTGLGNTEASLYPVEESLSIHRSTEGWGVRALPGLVTQVRKLNPEVILIQYTPHSFDRRGISIAVNLIPALSRAVCRARVITNFHELYVPFGRSVKQNVAAVWQRAAAIVIASGSHIVSATTTRWEHRLRRMGIRRPLRVIPVGSNIPDTQMTQEEHSRLRSQLLHGSDGLLLAAFGALHDRDVSAVLFALGRLKQRGHARLIWIGGGTPNRSRVVEIGRAMRKYGLQNNDVEWTGFLQHPDVSRLLKACDIAVLPFVDGLSTRRGSAVSALQHGLPLVSTHGDTLESCFVHGANVYLVPRGDREALADALVELRNRRQLRAQLSQGGRWLYEAHFAWDVIAGEVSSLVEEC